MFKYMNLWKLNGYMEAADPNGGSPTPAPTPSPTPAPAPAPSPAPTHNYTPEQIAAAVALLNQSNPAPAPKPDPYKEHLTAEEQAKQKREDALKLENDIKFNSSMDDFLTKNAALFPERSKQLLGKTYESEADKANQLRSFLARDFFSNENNVKLLPLSKQELVKEQLTGAHAKNEIKPQDAWELVQMALHTHETIVAEKRRQGFYDEPTEAEQHENVAKWIERQQKGTAKK